MATVDGLRLVDGVDLLLLDVLVLLVDLLLLLYGQESALRFGPSGL